MRQEQKSEIVEWLKSHKVPTAEEIWAEKEWKSEVEQLEVKSAILPAKEE